jgi:plastocyanin
LKLMLLAGLALGVLAACDKAGTGNTCASTGAITIDARDNQTYEPPSVTITPTQKVCWENLGTLTHTITADLVADSVDITLPPNFTFTKPFSVQGQDFHYHCRFHPGMVGLIQVR